MKALLASGILSILLCAPSVVHAHETKKAAEADRERPGDSKAVTTIEGTVKSVNVAKRTVVVVTAAGQEYVLPYVEQAKAPIIVGQKVTIVIKICYGKYCVTITIHA